MMNLLRPLPRHTDITDNEDNMQKRRVQTPETSSLGSLTLHADFYYFTLEAMIAETQDLLQFESFWFLIITLYFLSLAC